MSAIAYFQTRVTAWWETCFERKLRGETVLDDRFLEESLELFQALGHTKDQAHSLVEYVFNRKSGWAPQEVGGVIITLAALCQARLIDLESCADEELARVWSKIAEIRAKDAAKPSHSQSSYCVETIAEAKQNALREAAIAMCPLCSGGNKFVSREPLLESEHIANGGECRWFHRYMDDNTIAARCEAWKINDLIVKVPA